MDTFLCIMSGLLLMFGAAGHLYVRLRMRPDEDELDQYYHEFEDSHPGYARYTKWLRITFAAIAAAMLLLFLAMAV